MNVSFQLELEPRTCPFNSISVTNRQNYKQRPHFQGGSITLGEGATLSIAGSFTMSGGSITIGKGASMHLGAEFGIQGGSIELAEGASFGTSGQFGFQV